MPNVNAHTQNIDQTVWKLVCRQSLTAAVFMSFGLFIHSELSAADVLVLKGGGRLQGQFLVPPADNDLVYRFRTTDGIELTISKSEIEEIEQKGSPESFEEYEAKRSAMPDTVDGNLALARWCAENKMLNQRKAHYERVLELDPENVTARRALGFKKMIDGEWRTSDEEMEDQGKVQYKGRWVSIQEKELLEKQAEEKIQTRKLTGSIKKWVKMLGTAKEETALAELENLRDPKAVTGLLEAYKSEKKRPGVQKIIIKCLGRIGTETSISALLEIAVDDPIEELRLTALDNLKPNAGPGVTEYFISRLSPKRSTHPQINYAGHALGELNDPSAVPALIQALETTHKFQVVTGSQNGQTTAGVGRSSTGGSGTGFSMGSSVQVISQKKTNPEVLEALKKITKVNFMYDQARWIEWYQTQNGGAGASLRRE